MTEYIDREDVREMMRMEFDDDYADEAVDRLPAADVAPVRYGRWEDAAGDMMEPYYKCSVCEWAYAWWEPDEALYCPHCGAKMDGGKEND